MTYSYKYPSRIQPTISLQERIDQIVSPAQTPKMTFVCPRDIDVKCGRGKHCFQNPGNVLLRVLVANNLEVYRKQPTRMLKTKVVNSVISQVHSQGGRFLELDRHVGLWYDGGIKAAKQRVGSAFRDASQPNKVKCMEILKATIRTHNMNGSSVSNCLKTAIGMHSDDAESFSSPSRVYGGVDGAVMTSAPILRKRSSTEMVHTIRHSTFSSHGHSAASDDVHPPAVVFCRLDAPSNKFPLLAVSDESDGEENQATIDYVESFSMLQGLEYDDANLSAVIIEGMNDIDEIWNEDLEGDPKQFFNRREKKFLAALDWTKLASCI